jgi:hypothetical protein
MPIGITAYVLPKQAHFDVRLCFEGTPIPPGTAAVFIPGLDLNDASRQVILDYLNRGGRVYQSYYNNFGTAISSGNDTLIHAPRMTVNEPAGQMEAFQPIAAGAGGIYRKTSCSSSAMVHAAWQVKQYEDPAPGTVVFASQRIGKGTYFYFAGNLEASLSKIYDPWENSEAHLIYGALRPESAVAADNKYVELYSKSDGKRKLILLLNHSAGYQPVTIRVIRPMCLTNYESLENLGEGNEFTFLLKPGEVVVAMDCESLAD